jgi:TolA-binding protein
MKRITLVLLLLTCLAIPVQSKEASKKDLEKLTEHVERLEERIKELENLTLPLEDEMRAQARSIKFRKIFQERMNRDEKKYKKNELQEMDRLYQTATRKWNTVIAKESLERLIEKYDNSNRAGCSMLYLGQMSMGEHKRDYLKKAIKRYSECWYGDGVQVGAYGRFLLGIYYKENGDNKEADKFFKEILNKYPDSIDHKGQMLKDLIRNIK